MIMKLTILLLILAILYTLGSGLFYLIRKEEGDSAALAKKLNWRIGLSMGLFSILIYASLIGWIHPHALFPETKTQIQQGLQSKESS